MSHDAKRYASSQDYSDGRCEVFTKIIKNDGTKGHDISAGVRPADIQR